MGYGYFTPAIVYGFYEHEVSKMISEAFLSKYKMERFCQFVNKNQACLVIYGMEVNIDDVLAFGETKTKSADMKMIDELSKRITEEEARFLQVISNRSDYEFEYDDYEIYEPSKVSGGDEEGDNN